ncbi:hypothetical protein HOLleu_20831 [Holothuria leucospilota]|uniref:Mutator-like transposase domain-containing protein n=1 Tax=Holothuria leucospilota TaxID=206669 RepID=A0A9Q1BWF1_HOLLE|nr:hypothetical protein HOLleu_20831 [Holothuria leucospilota]
MEVGLAREGIADMCSILSMPPPSTSTSYGQHVRTVFQSSEEEEAEAQMAEAVKRARAVAVGGEDSGEEVINLPVTFDGTWAKRGFTSNYGVGVVISADTGEVLDREVLSKICDECNMKNQMDKEGEDYKLWWEGHKNRCTKNFQGSSPAMEAATAKILWQRSISKHKVKYSHMISDGDSKAFSEVQYIYGDSAGEAVEKLDCIGHVGKRMFRALDKIKKETKGKLADGKTVGGGKGRLTGGQNGMVGKLSELYRNAIRKNVDRLASKGDQDKLENAKVKMQRAILAVLYHEVKLPDNSVRHQYCPTDDWCEYKNSGTMDDKDHHLDAVFLDLLLPTFQRLSESSLIERCIPGYTQNQTESFNALIWKRCPKHLWRGPLYVKTATNLAVLHFNCGALSSRNRMLQSLKLTSSHHTMVANMRKDRVRISAADKACEESEKKKRKKQTKEKLVQEEDCVEREGVMYESGAF